MFIFISGGCVDRHKHIQRHKELSFYNVFRISYTSAICLIIFLRGCSPYCLRHNNMCMHNEVWGCAEIFPEKATAIQLISLSGTFRWLQALSGGFRHFKTLSNTFRHSVVQPAPIDQADSCWLVRVQ